MVLIFVLGADQWQKPQKIKFGYEKKALRLLPPSVLSIWFSALVRILSVTFMYLADILHAIVDVSIFSLVQQNVSYQAMFLDQNPLF